MTSILRAALFAAACGCGMAAVQPGQPSATEIANQVQARYDRVRDFSADFTQEIVLPAEALAAADGRVVFTCDKFFVPAQRDGSMDQRHLALRMYGYSVR